MNENIVSKAEHTGEEIEYALSLTSGELIQLKELIEYTGNLIIKLNEVKHRLILIVGLVIFLFGLKLIIECDPCGIV